MSFLGSKVVRMETNQRILIAARSRFLSFGFAKVTMDEIASDIGISKRTLYQHFESKEVLLREAMLDKLTEVTMGVAGIVERSGPSPADKLSELVVFLARRLPRFSKVFLEDMRRYAPDLWVELDERRNRAVKGSFRKLILEGQKEGTFRSDLNLELLLLILEALLHRVVNPDALAELPWTLAQVVVEILEILSIGIVTDEGRWSLQAPLKEGGTNG